MRISDWSSDVCSSDLIPCCGPLRLERPAPSEQVQDWRAARRRRRKDHGRDELCVGHLAGLIKRGGFEGFPPVCLEIQTFDWREAKAELGRRPAFDFSMAFIQRRPNAFQILESTILRSAPT